MNYIGYGENRPYNYSEKDNYNENDSRIVKVIASNKCGHIGNFYHIEIFDKNKNIRTDSTTLISIEKFIEYSQDNDQYTFILTDIPEEMTNYKHKYQAVELFDLDRLKNCYYPYWWF